MSSNAQKRASRTYEARNPNKTRYDTAKRNVKRFINPKPGSTMSEAIDKYGQPFYIDDLKDFELAIRQRLDELDK